MDLTAAALFRYANATNPVYYAGAHIGSVTIGGHGFRIDKNIAFPYLDPQYAELDARLSVGFIAHQYMAIIVVTVLYDPENKLVRS